MAAGNKSRQAIITKESKSPEVPNLKAVYRVLDANLNRAREGLRVLEDTARFVWDSARLFRQLRTLRHRLDRTARAFYPDLVSSRASVADPGRRVPEKTTRDWKGLVAANFRRCEEAVRVLEEYGKVLGPAAVSDIKGIRFSLYSAEKEVVTKYS